MKIIWHGHACFEVVTDEGSIVFDPYADGALSGLKLPTLYADAVICSHGHSDHNGADKVVLSGKAPTFEITQLNTWHDECGGNKRGNNLITVISAEGLRLAHCGDLGHELSKEQLSALGRIDILMIPVGGVYTVDAVTAKRVAESVSPTMIIPMHYRGCGGGLKNIASCDEFTGLFTENMVQYLKNNELIVTKPVTPSVTVFAWRK